MSIKIGIIGVGFVGDALLNSFKLKELEPIYLYDKYKKIGNFKQVLHSTILFLCLPTLFDSNSGEYNKLALNEVCTDLSKHKFEGLVVIKSTVEPGTSENMASKYNLPIIHNPEFLTARTARDDFHNQKHIVLGTTSKCKEEKFLELKSFYEQNYPHVKISTCKSWESEAMKIFVNSFYATKVQIFNEFYLLCQKEGQNYNQVLELMLTNGWINPMHTMVPGPDGKLSYGGACFPKDTQAILNHMKRRDIPSEVLAACISENIKMRGINK